MKLSDDVMNKCLCFAQRSREFTCSVRRQIVSLRDSVAEYITYFKPLRRLVFRHFKGSSNFSGELRLESYQVKIYDTVLRSHWLDG